MLVQNGIPPRSLTSPSATNSFPKAPTFVPGELIVKFRSAQGVLSLQTQADSQHSTTGTNASAAPAQSTRHRPVSIQKLFAPSRKARINAASAAGKSRANGDDRTYRLTFDKSADVMQLVSEYSKDPNVEYAQPNYICRAQMLPNDYYFNTDLSSPPVFSWNQSYPDLWGLKTTQCDKAWDTAQGDGIVVAVVDTGIDATHPDITANVWHNPNEIAGNGIDDDGNGYVDDVSGWNFVNGTNSPVDDVGHGTHCAGIIAAVGNNGIGVIGVAPMAT